MIYKHTYHIIKMVKTLIFKKSKANKKTGFKHQIKGYNKNGALIIQIKDKITKEKVFIPQGFVNMKTVNKLLEFIKTSTPQEYKAKFERSSKFNNMFENDK